MVTAGLNGGPARLLPLQGYRTVPPYRIETGVIMRVVGVNTGSQRPNGFAERQPDYADTAPAAPGQALVALAPVARAESAASPVRRQAAFLAHLIAGRDQHAQTRERRRAEPAVAHAAYRAAAKLNHQN